MRLRALLTVVATIVVPACGDVSLSPGTPASIEFDPLPAPAVVLGDTLRDINGVLAPATATVRNQAGDILTDAPLQFTYADASRDSALMVDSISGLVVSLRPLATSTTQARIVARAGGNLQAIRTVLVTTRPDLVARSTAAGLDTLRTTLPDTGSGVAANTSGALSVVVSHLVGSVATQVPNWLVQFTLVSPANPSNDTTANVFLVNDSRKPSTIDTTDGSGIASRYVRVRASKFPVGNAVDSAEVSVVVRYRGVPVKGSPVRIVLPVIKKPPA